MATHKIVMDGPITEFGYSKQYFRNAISGHEKDKVILVISSLGGNVDDAISIYDQIKEHGNVEIQLSSFVASAATFLTLGAKKISMNENAFYLIHKAMNWVDAWDLMNEDEIEALIEKLEKQKKELAKVTLQLARMYVAKTGKPLEEIITLMKQETWLTAEEAKQWGFVDEITKAEEPENIMENQKMVAMITSNGLPLPGGKTLSGEPDTDIINEESLFNRMFEKISNKLKNRQKENPQKPKNTQMEKSFLNVNKILNADSLESSDQGVYLNEEQLQLIEDHIALENQIVVERDNAISERDSAKQELTNTIDQFNAIDKAVAEAESTGDKINAVRALLAARPGVNPEGTRDTKDPSNQTKDIDWETIDKLAHNLEVD
jgi:ATP-dependent Clp protease, protease subunit